VCQRKREEGRGERKAKIGSSSDEKDKDGRRKARKVTKRFIVEG